MIRIKIYSDAGKFTREYTAKKKFYVLTSSDASGLEYTSKKLGDIDVEIRYDCREIWVKANGAFDTYLMDNIIGWGWE